MPMGLGYGAAQGLEQVLARQFQQALEAQRVKEQQQAFQMQQQGLDLNRERLAQDQSRFESTQDSNERLRAANMAMQGTEMAHTANAEAAERDLAERTRAANLAMEGTALASRQNLQDDQQAFVAGQNTLDRQADQSLLSARLATASSPASAPEGPSAYSQERMTRTLESVDSLIGQVGGLTAGAGSMLANFPGTAARDFQAELDTLKANIAFGELTAMREASKTGGALGQVSERELALLESALGALDAGQSPENLREQLVKIRDSVERWRQAVMAQSLPGAGITATPSAGTGRSAADYLSEGGF